MAEAVFAHKVRQAGLEDKIASDSCGTGHWHLGEPPHRGTRDVLKRQGIAYDHRARLIRPQDLQEYDYILAMDTDNLRDIQRMGSADGRLKLLMSYAPETGHSEVPDPYYDGRFDLVYSLVDRATDGLLASIRREHHLGSKEGSNSE